jgi:hypothetical protein
MAARGGVGTVREVALSSLSEWERNPKTIDPAPMQELQRAMVADPEMLWVRPLLALLDGTVFCGNQRLRAARALGWKTIPVATVDLDPARVAVWALRDNNQYGHWHEPSLAELLAELEQDGVDLALTGFTSSDLDRLLEGFRAEPDPDEAPPLPTGEPDSKPGETYELGANRLLCGDSRDPEALVALLAGEQAGMFLTDPPYGVAYQGKTERGLRIRNDDADGLGSLLREAFWRPIGCSPRTPRSICSARPGRTEPSSASPFRTPAGGCTSRLSGRRTRSCSAAPTTTTSTKTSSTAGRAAPAAPAAAATRRAAGTATTSSRAYSTRPTRSELHPTQKPVELLTRMLENSSRRGDLVLRCNGSRAIAFASARSSAAVVPTRVRRPAAPPRIVGGGGASLGNRLTAHDTVPSCGKDSENAVTLPAIGPDTLGAWPSPSLRPPCAPPVASRCRSGHVRTGEPARLAAERGCRGARRAGCPPNCSPGTRRWRVSNSSGPNGGASRHHG